MTKTLMIVALSLAAAPVWATGEHSGSHADPANAELDRTIEFNAGDMWFDPQALRIAPGNTVKFVVTNTGRVKHEFVIGNTQAQKEHRLMMQKNQGSGHGSDGHSHGGGMPSVTVAPGETATLLWTAPEDVDALEYACNIPGHYEAGMHGTIKLQG